jgi:hypothetical protein
MARMRRKARNIGISGRASGKIYAGRAKEKPSAVAGRRAFPI